jgi:hypothetical protein
MQILIIAFTEEVWISLDPRIQLHCPGNMGRISDVSCTTSSTVLGTNTAQSLPRRLAKVNSSTLLMARSRLNLLVAALRVSFTASSSPGWEQCLFLRFCLNWSPCEFPLRRIDFILRMVGRLPLVGSTTGSRCWHLSVTRSSSATSRVRISYQITIIAYSRRVAHSFRLAGHAGVFSLLDWVSYSGDSYPDTA